MQTTYPEGWLRLTRNDRRQHFFRDGMSVCGRFVTPTHSFPADDGPDRQECTGCRHIVDTDQRPTIY